MNFDFNTLLKKKQLGAFDKIKNSNAGKKLTEKIKTEIKSANNGFEEYLKKSELEKKSNTEIFNFKQNKYIKKVTLYYDIEDDYAVCPMFYYPTLEETLKRNLPCSKRPWETPEGSGTEVFSNATIYRPIQMHNYIKKWYIDYFNDKKILSPFQQDINNVYKTITDICTFSNISLQPHQKFAGSHMSYFTDFNSLLCYYKIGSGKTATALAIAELNKGKYIKDGNFKIREGAKINIKKEGSDSYERGIVNTIIVVPKQTKEQYLKTFLGSIKNGKLQSLSASIIYVEKDQELDDGYNRYRQYYTGTSKKNGDPNIDDLNRLETYEVDIIDLTIKKMKIEEDNKNIDQSNLELRMDTIKNLNDMELKIKEIKNKIIYLKTNIVKNIENVYYIISQDTFLNRLSTRDDIFVPSEYLLGKNTTEEGLPHPDFFHSKKTVLIFDEIHKKVSSEGKGYKRLYSTLLIYARDKILGTPTVKTVFLTGTPIFDNAHEAALVLNLHRPRILFPLSRELFESHFIDKKAGRNRNLDVMKNKLCFQYMFSGYISYSQGISPVSFPYRRNIYKIHVMQSEQLNGYLEKLAVDISKTSDKKEEENSVFNSFFNIEKQQTQEGRFLHPREACNIYIPSITKTHSGPENVTANIEKLFEDISRINTYEKKLEYFSKYSEKFAFIIKKILESEQNDNEGPIMVYCEWVWYGIVPFVRMLQQLGWSLYNNEKIGSYNNKRIGIWSGDALNYLLGLKTDKDQEAYISNLQKIISCDENKNGRMCKVLITTVTEGIDLKYISQVHLTMPWWNESKMEQIVGRGIRFCSHNNLPPERQYVDIYYHCSVLSKDYKSVNSALLGQLETKINNERAKVSRRTTTKFVKVKQEHIRNHALLTMEQTVYITAKRKNRLNIQFDNAIKETAIDIELNKYTNLIRLEEIINENIRGKNEAIKIFYDRSKDKYYLYNIVTKSLYSTEMISEIQDTELFQIWPPIDYKSGVKIDIKKEWELSNIVEQKMPNGDLMISIIVSEDIKSFNSNPEVCNKNFYELMDYAIKKGEEPFVWKYYSNAKTKNELMEIIFALYRVQNNEGFELLQNFKSTLMFNDDKDPNIQLSKINEQNKILGGGGMKTMLVQLAEITKDEKFFELSKKFTDNPTISNQEIEIKRDKYKKQFDKNIDMGKVVTMRDFLVKKKIRTSEQVGLITNEELELLYTKEFNSRKN